MPKFKIAGHFGFVGTDWSDVIEVDDLQSAEEWAREYALDRVEWWAEPIEDDESEEGGDEE